MTPNSLFRISATVIFAVALGRLAAANAPSGRYTVSAGTVYDTKTKLTWQQVSPSTTYAVSGGAAENYCSGLSATLGGTGWRLPTVKELLTIVDYSKLANGPMPGLTAIDPVFQFPSNVISFWSSTAVAGYPGSGWIVNFQSGIAERDITTSGYFVRCVR